MNPSEHVINIVYQELINLVGRGADIPLKKQNIMLVGLQGSERPPLRRSWPPFFSERGCARPSSAPIPFAPEPTIS